MKVFGKIIFEKTPGRKDPWVKMQTEHDYFLALQITQIDDTKITTTSDMYNAISKHFPEIIVNKENVSTLFGNVSLPPGAKDVPHITLGNFPDFRINRSVHNDIDMQKVNAAIEVENQTVSFEISERDFELVVANKDPSIKDAITTAASITVAPTVGRNRDAILNLKPSPHLQETLQGFSREVFGKEFQLWNSQNMSVPYHLTLAQTDQLSNKLEQAPKHQIEEIHEKYYRLGV